MFDSPLEGRHLPGSQLASADRLRGGKRGSTVRRRLGTGTMGHDRAVYARRDVGRRWYRRHVCRSIRRWLPQWERGTADLGRPRRGSCGEAGGVAGARPQAGRVAGVGVWGARGEQRRAVYAAETWSALVEPDVAAHGHQQRGS